MTIKLDPYVLRQLQRGLLAFVFLAVLFLAGCSNFKNIRIPEIGVVSKPTITIMSFNIRHGCGNYQPPRTSSHFYKTCRKNLYAVAAAIQSADPDVVGLQEVDDFHASKLAKVLNMNYAYSSHNSEGYGSWWGNAILSKFPILDAERKAVGGYGQRNRSILTATADVNGQRMKFISIHTHHELNNDRSVRKIMNYVNAISEPVVFIGDFNMEPDDVRTKLITYKGYFIDTAEAVETDEAIYARWNGTLRGRRIDYVFVQPLFFEVLDAGLVTDKYQSASDHVAYYTKVKIKKP